MKKIHAVDVSVDNNGEIAIHQQWNDMNHDDPIVTGKKRQVYLTDHPSQLHKSVPFN